MKPHYKLYLLLFIVCSFIASCTALDGDEFFTFSPRGYRFSSDGGEMTFTLDKKKYAAWYFTDVIGIPFDEKLKEFFSQRATFTGSESFQVEGDYVSVYKDSQNNIRVTMSKNDTGEEREVILHMEETKSKSVPCFSEVIFYQDK